MNLEISVDVAVIPLKFDNDVRLYTRLNHTGERVIIIDHGVDKEIELLPDEALRLGLKLIDFSESYLVVATREVGKEDRRKEGINVETNKRSKTRRTDDKRRQRLPKIK